MNKKLGLFIILPLAVILMGILSLVLISIYDFTIGPILNNIQESGAETAQADLTVNFDPSPFHPGMEVNSIVTKLEGASMNCGKFEKFSTHATNKEYFYATCTLIQGVSQNTAYIFSADLSRVDLIDANCLQTSDISDSEAEEFLRSIAVLPLEGSDIGKAENWVHATLGHLQGDIGEIEETDIGGMKIRLYGKPGERSLEIGELR